MKFTLTKNNLLNIYFFLFVFILITYIFRQINKGFPKEGWIITEFLINYQGGFVRRGLLGEIIFQVYNFTGLAPYTFILILSILSFIALIWFFLKSFIKKGYPIFFIPFVFFLGNPIIHDFWVKKDILLILIFIITIYFAVKKSKWYLILVNFFLIIGILIHESIGFFSFPILILILLSKSKNFINSGIKPLIQSILISIFQLIPSIFTFLSVLYFHGSENIANRIWNSWESIPFPLQQNTDNQISGAILGLTWTLKRSILMFWDSFFLFKDNIYVPLGWVIVILLIYFILTNTSKLNYKILNYKPVNYFNKTNISNLLIIQFVSIMPLFILGVDYGRWLFYWTMSSFVLILIIPENVLSTLEII